jgi:hypothetical protein
MNDPVFTNRYVREVLALVALKPKPHHELTERQIFEGVKQLSREPLTVDELREAMNWNLARRYVEARNDDDLGREVFSLTLTGKQKEKLA